MKQNLPKIPKYGYDIKYLKQKMISKNTGNILRYLNDGDLSEIKIALNEIITILYSSNKAFLKLTYWYLWLIKFIRLNKKTVEIKVEKKCNLKIDENTNKIGYGHCGE